MMGWYNTDGVGAGGWIAMIAMMVMFWGLVIFAGVMIFRGTATGRGGNDHTQLDRASSRRDSMDILDERFARGEIDSDEYEMRKAVLRGSKR